MSKVIVYTTEWCPWCRKTKDFLKQHNVEFEEKDVEKDIHAAEEMVEKSEQSGIPVIDIDGKIVIGFNEEALRKLLKIE
jgi:glutaredoxin-like YruB-family protein